MHSSVVCQCSSCNTGEICSCFGVSATILACVLNRLKFLDIVCFGGPHGSELRVRMVGSELNHTRTKRGKKEKKKNERRVVFSPVFFPSTSFWPRYLNPWNRLVTKELRRLRLSCLFGHWLALSPDCKTKARNCNIASFKGSILTSLFSL